MKDYVMLGLWQQSAYLSPILFIREHKNTGADWLNAILNFHGGTEYVRFKKLTELLHTELTLLVYLLWICMLGQIMVLLGWQGGFSPSFLSFADICEALNVTVSPGPTVRYSEGDNATLFCHISQKRKTDNLLAVRWVFAASPTQEYLMIKMTKFGSVQYYGNYTHNFHKQRLRLLKEKHGALYKFLILSLQQTDQGHYICKVQEIGKHRNKWTAWSNGTAATEIRGEKSLISVLSFFLSYDLSVKFIRKTFEVKLFF